jgi:glycerophosphoryl diester phosphodiesterase
MKSRYLAQPRPRLFGHRGASAHYPENTLPAFQAAIEAGVPYLELDVWATRDGIVVAHHDETLLRLCGDPRRISDVTLAELKALDAGCGFSPDGLNRPCLGQGITVPTLAEVFAACPAAFFNIEIKQEAPAIEEQVLAVIEAAGMADRVLLAAEQDAIMQRLRSLCGPIPTSFSFDELAAFFAWLQGGCQGDYRPPGAALQIPETWGGRTLVTPETVRAAHALGLEVHVWTVNEPQDMERLLGFGVDGLMSDYPERLVAVAGKRRDVSADLND